MSKLAKLKKQHDDFITAAKLRGTKTATYTVPCCGNTMEDRLAPAGDTWDTLANCAHCGSLYMKISTSTTVTGLLPETA